MIENYVQHLKAKFPNCRVENIPFRDQRVIIVSHKEGSEWFELPIVFDGGITQEQFGNITDILDRWELKIDKRLNSMGLQSG